MKILRVALISAIESHFPMNNIRPTARLRNPSPDPMFASGTAPAGPQPRHP
jgi:hypothetical protein